MAEQGNVKIPMLRFNGGSLPYTVSSTLEMSGEFIFTNGMIHYIPNNRSTFGNFKPDSVTNLILPIVFKPKLSWDWDARIGKDPRAKELHGGQVKMGQYVWKNGAWAPFQEEIKLHGRILREEAVFFGKDPEKLDFLYGLRDPQPNFTDPMAVNSTMYGRPQLWPKKGPNDAWCVAKIGRDQRGTWTGSKGDGGLFDN